MLTQNGVLRKDENDYPVMGGTSAVDNQTIINSAFDPVTRRLLVDIAQNIFIYNEIVSGSGTTFTLSNTPVSGAYAIYAQGQRLYPTTDFTISGAVITTVNSWLAGEILADYQYA